MEFYASDNPDEPAWYSRYVHDEEWYNPSTPPFPNEWIDNEDEKKSNESDEMLPAAKFGFRLCCTTALHPLDYAKTLIQLGYEPIAPRLGRTLFVFGAKRLWLPNTFRYVYHIGTVDGFQGCFRGLRAKLLGNVLSTLCGPILGCFIQQSPIEEDFFFHARRVVTMHVAGVVISHPFHVISIRMMAQFVGREQLYNGLWQSVKEIWKSDGIMGFFSGIVPRLIVELGCIAVTSTISLLFSLYVKDRGIRKIVDTIAHYTVSKWFYPYQVVSTCMIVNGSRLKAGNPPVMEHFCWWPDCYRHLRMSNDHKRGASFFFRRAQPAKQTSYSSIAPYPKIIPGSRTICEINDNGLTFQSPGLSHLG